MTGHEYVTEGRPNVDVNWEDQFTKQRKSRLADAIGEYLTDPDLDDKQAYEEILSEVEGWVSYYKEYLEKSEGLRDRLLGMKPVDFK